MKNRLSLVAAAFFTPVLATLILCVGPALLFQALFSSQSKVDKLMEKS